MPLKSAPVALFKRIALLSLLAIASSAFAQQDVLTYHNNNSRNGLNNKETKLTLTNVNQAMFGKLFTLPTDGIVDAEPLFISSLSIGGVVHNVLIVVTEHGTVYAYDADTGAVLWQVTTLKTGETSSDKRGCSQVSPEIGITSTPVIMTIALGG